MSSQQQVSISFSSAQRNKKKWPHANCYEIKLPMPVQRVRQVALGAIELPLDTDVIKTGEEQHLPVSEGDIVCSEDAQDCCPSQEQTPSECSNAIMLCEEGGGEACLALPVLGILRWGNWKRRHWHQFSINTIFIAW